MKKFIKYFSEKHLFANLFFTTVLLCGFILWNKIPKEELPDMTLDFVQISVAYPGASAEEVEHFVTWPIEKELKSVSGIEDIRSTSSEGKSLIMVELEKNLNDRSSIISDVKNSVLSVNLPAEILDLPVMREFKSSRKAILDLGIYLDGVEFLSDRDRKKLQTHAHTLENRLLALPEVNTVNKTGYLKEETQILLDPSRLESYRIPLSTVISVIKNSSVRQPAGSLKSVDEERVTIDGELDQVPEFLSLPIQGNFEGERIDLSRLASVIETYEERTSIVKINGHEAVILNVVKNSDVGILKAVDAVRKDIANFRGIAAKDGVAITLLDDESMDVRNRISLVGSNGLIGFMLVLATLFLFLNFRTGFWVAMGIPFTFSFTLVICYILGYTVNNMTLAAVLIVMGMIVDDAIVVSENIIRLRQQGADPIEAAVEGTAYVLLPITASVLTTCAAFLPLLSLEGRVSFMSDPIPPIVSIMLLASLLESLIILPSHMNLHVPRWLRIVMTMGILPLIERRFKKKDPIIASVPEEGRADHWFHQVEQWYSALLYKILGRRSLVLLFFFLFLVTGVAIFTTTMKFALFPREETTEVLLTGETPEGTRQYQTAKMAGACEAVFKPYLGREVVGFRTTVALSRHGMAAKENQFQINIEILPAEKREKSLNQLIAEWDRELKTLTGFSKMRFLRSHFGSESGSSIEVVIQENDNRQRDVISRALMDRLKKVPGLVNIETGEPYRSPEYKINLNRGLIKRLGIDPSAIGQAFRTAVEGTVIYEIISGDEEKNVRVTMGEKNRADMSGILSVPVVNNEGYLVPLREVITLNKTTGPVEIQRLNNQRSVHVYADIAPAADLAPLEVASFLEATIFPPLSHLSPSTIFSFDGEIKFTRETTGYFPITVVMALFLIFVILALQFNSLTRPLIIMMAIPAAVSSVAYIYLLHGMTTYGFFGVIGAIGLSGVVVNDAIVLLKKLDDEKIEYSTRKALNRRVAETAATRLRAVLLTTITTVAALFPTAYGVTGYDSMLAEMMLALAWGLVFGTFVTLIMIPVIYSLGKEMKFALLKSSGDGGRI